MGQPKPAIANDSTDTPSSTQVQPVSATTQPDAPDSTRVAPAAKPARTARSKRKYGISLYRAWCKRCSICGAFCPTDALINDDLGLPHVANEAKCTGCMQCVHRCPDFCVEVYEKSPSNESTRAEHDQADE